MANQQQLSILKQGVDIWNRWREENTDVRIDLSEANLSGTDLKRANLMKANLKHADLRHADLKRANLRIAILNGADLSGSDLRSANLWSATLFESSLADANLIEANFSETKLIKTNLQKAQLYSANLNGANLNEAHLNSAYVGNTIFANIELHKTLGLEETEHSNPSTIGFDTVRRSKGKIPERFLRGCGLSDMDIEFSKLFNPELSNEEVVKIQYRIYDLCATRAIQISPLFISYSHADSAFVDMIETNLNEKGVRFWRDIHDMKSGRMEKQVDRAMRLNPTVLLILSEHSLQSDWVEHEVRTARSIEKDMRKDVLCPIALDDSWKNSPWSKRIMEQVMEYNILDFSEWKDNTKFRNTFSKLIDGLELFYK